MTEDNKITLGKIFAKTKNRERFTEDSLIYQKILKFSILGIDHQSFTRWKMCKWLRDNHPSFEKRPVVNLQELVERKIENVIKLQLIHEIGTQAVSKGTGQTPVYAFDSTSYFLAWLIESLSIDQTRRTEAANKIFNIMFLMLELIEPNAATSTNMFLKTLVRKFKDNGLFEYLVTRMIELLESDNTVEDVSGLIIQSLIFRGERPEVINNFNQIWKETMDELEPRSKEIFLFRLKLYYENRMRLNAHDVAQFEKARFDARERYDKLILECGCLSCLCITYEMIDLIEYTTKLRYHIEGYSALEKDCPSCKNKSSLQIIDL